MRYLTLGSVLWLLCGACADDDANVANRPQNTEKSPDAGSGDKSKDSGAPRSSSAGLARPGLVRAPGSSNALPAELRPPR